MSGEERKFDWRPPPESRRPTQYPVATLLNRPVTLYDRTWPLKKHLDQGSEGACVGFGWAHELSAAPKQVEDINNGFARALYEYAKTMDEWPGSDYEGTSVNAGGRAVKALGFIGEYRWAANVTEVFSSLSALGPCVLGTNWHSDMMNTDSSGFIHPTGSIIGGHAICIVGLTLGEPNVVTLRNSWGRDWGVDGNCYLTEPDLNKLFYNEAEACIPLLRKKNP